MRWYAVWICVLNVPNVSYLLVWYVLCTTCSLHWSMPIVHSRPSKFLKTKNNATSRNDYLCFRPWLLNWRTAVRVRTSRVLNSDLYSFFNLLWGCKKGLPGLGTDLIESGTKTVLNCSDDLFFFIYNRILGLSLFQIAVKIFFWTGPKEASFVSGPFSKSSWLP